MQNPLNPNYQRFSKLSQDILINCKKSEFVLKKTINRIQFMLHT